MPALQPLPDDEDRPASPSSSELWLLRAVRALVVFVYAVVIVDLVMLTLGFFLRLFGAGVDAPFTQWVYRGVARIMEPFRGIFPSHEVSDRSMLDVSLLFAMIVYTMAAVGLHAFVVWVSGRIAAQRRRDTLEAARAEAAAVTPPAVEGRFGPGGPAARVPGP